MKSVRIRSFSGPYFPAFGLNTYLSVFSLNAGKYVPQKLLIRTLFTQCLFSITKIYFGLRSLEKHKALQARSWILDLIFQWNSIKCQRYISWTLHIMNDTYHERYISWTIHIMNTTHHERYISVLGNWIAVEYYNFQQNAHFITCNEYFNVCRVYWWKMDVPMSNESSVDDVGLMTWC